MKYLIYTYLVACLSFHQLGVSAFTVNYSQSKRLTRSSHDHGRMLAMSTTDRQQTDNEVSDGIHGIPKITSITSRDELFEFLAEDERLIVVKFYATWCKSCARFGLKLKKFAKKHGDLVDEHEVELHKGDIRFAEIEYSKNMKLCKTFGIKKLPFVQIYKAKNGRIDEFVCGPKDFNEKVVKRVEDILEMSDDEISFLKDMDNGQIFVNELAADNSTSVSASASDMKLV